MKYTKKGFTLIEMLIAMSIFFILVVMTYVNYAYFENISRVKMSLKHISQSINEARNMAISGYQVNGINQSIGVYFDTNNKNVIKFYSFNYNSGVILNDANLIKERKIENNVGIDSISGKDNIMIYFSSIYGNPEIYYFDRGVKNVFSGSELNFVVSFKNSTNFPLKRELKYFKNTNVLDY